MIRSIPSSLVKTPPQKKRRHTPGFGPGHFHFRRNQICFELVPGDLRRWSAELGSQRITIKSSVFQLFAHQKSWIFRHGSNFGGPSFFTIHLSITADISHLALPVWCKSFTTSTGGWEWTHDEHQRDEIWLKSLLTSWCGCRSAVPDLENCFEFLHVFFLK